MRALLPPVLLLAITGCYTPYVPSETAVLEEIDSGESGDAFAAAAEDFEVPVEILQAIAQAETGMQSVTGAEEFEDRPAAWGIMALREDVLPEAAALAGFSEDAVKNDRAANIAAAAALLAEWAAEAGIETTDLGAWAPIVARYSGIEAEEDAAFYVHDEVYAALRAGIQLEGGAALLWDGEPDFRLPVRPASGNGGDRSYAVWRASPNHSARPSGANGDPTLVVIHTCEGSYSGCWSWLRNSQSGVSAHYVVNSNGSEVTQLVREDRKAWHISATYDCGRNSNVECAKNGRSSNDFTIGIEHAGYGSQSSWDAGLLATSAQLVCDITRDNGIPRDAYHVVAHGRLQPYNRSDPGPNWPWAQYLADVRARCDGSSPAPVEEEEESNDPPPQQQSQATAREVVVDSNNAYNDGSRSRLVVSSNWRSSQSVAGYYKTGYFWRSTGDSADSARFEMKLDASGCYAVEAWWTAGSDRAPQAPYVITDPAGATVASVNVDQRSGGGRWNRLGTYNLLAGWNTVSLSRWAEAGDVVVADAVRAVPTTGCAGGDVAETPPASGWQKTIDTNMALNGPDTDVDIPLDWTAATATAGYYGSDYLFKDTGNATEPVSFWFRMDAPTRVRVEARWTAGTNRASAAAFRVLNPADQTVGIARVDQRQNHATWVELGEYNLPAGWNRVHLSREGSAGAVVIADAVRITSVP